MEDTRIGSFDVPKAEEEAERRIKNLKEIYAKKESKGLEFLVSKIWLGTGAILTATGVGLEAYYLFNKNLEHADAYFVGSMTCILSGAPCILMSAAVYILGKIKQYNNKKQILIS